MNILKLPCIVFAVLLFARCETKAEGTLENGGRVTMNIDAVLGSQISAILQKAGGRAGAPLLDAQYINNSLKENKAVEKADLKQNGARGIKGEIIIKQIETALPKNAKDFIEYKQNGNNGSMRIKIDRKNGQAVLSLISSDIQDYISTLMAPIATGEELGKDEYLELVRSVYNAALAKEIEAARFSLKLTMPAVPVSVSGGIATGKTAEFNTALLDLLVLEKPVVYEIVW
ncbi:MAG: hypothetical protein LBG79_03340 [Spirochaetaceae bacterium]|jgi:hypothetical protein|nr:hypothetical protein [Spirochaetaceae bacterium]GMO17538.1 MAG: hypothetical protein Pg6A_04000 [Termitinemataceae bacterium]